jgi:hypothetical protein
MATVRMPTNILIRKIKRRLFVVSRHPVKHRLQIAAAYLLLVSLEKRLKKAA